MSESSTYRLATRLVHAGEIRPRVLGAVSMPVFQSANFVEEDATGGDYHSTHYMRLSNLPNQEVLHRKLAALEGAEAALVTASGMAAISTALLTVLKAGDHVLFQDCLYGGTHNFITEDLPQYGIAFDFLEGDAPDLWARRLHPRTRAIYVETMTNPMLHVTNLQAVVEFARAHGLVSMIDNTTASPLYFRPAEWGFDLSLHSCTKYLNGHSDLVGGAVLGSADLVVRIHHKLNHLGGSLDAHACSLLHRGMKTLSVRLPAQSANALALARMLEGHPAVELVRYPGLPGDLSHENARRFLDGFGGLVSFALTGGAQAAATFQRRLRLVANAPSFGGVESLATRPATTSHAGLTPEARASLGITDGLVRVAVGIEATEDLLEDFQQALDGLDRGTHA
jgi:cystathionine beta-lyase/cystathionine gamma-synthase